jgi:hypothetical protein
MTRVPLLSNAGQAQTKAKDWHKFWPESSSTGNDDIVLNMCIAMAKRKCASIDDGTGADLGVGSGVGSGVGQGADLRSTPTLIKW